MKVILLSCAALSGILASEQAGAQTSGGLKSWHEEIDSLRQSVDSGGDGLGARYNAFMVEIGTPLRRQSINMITNRCLVPKSDVNVLEGVDLPSFSGRREISAKAALPEFLKTILNGIGLSAARYRQQSISFSFSDYGQSQIAEAELEEALNEPGCAGRIKPGKFDVVRGVIFGRLEMSSKTVSSDELALAVKSETGFEVKHNKAGDWAITQQKQRPWFLLVSSAYKSKKGKITLVD